jgi:PTS system cellobiose-specific IIA component
MDMEHAQVAMQIILHAGDARTKTMEAMKALRDFDTETAKKHMKEAQADIVKAHNVQTEALQKEAQGEEIEYSILFSHAQDSCMTVYSEMNMAEHFIDICESINRRFEALEK